MTTSRAATATAVPVRMRLRILPVPQACASGRAGGALGQLGTGDLEVLAEYLEQGRTVQPADVEAALRMGASPDDALAPSPTEQLEMFASGPIEVPTDRGLSSRPVTRDDYRTVAPAADAARDCVPTMTSA